jgi:hypothetical protein
VTWSSYGVRFSSCYDIGDHYELCKLRTQLVVEITKRGRGVEGGRGAEKYEREREREI